MSIQGEIFGIYTYNGVRVFRIKDASGREVYVDDDMKIVHIRDDRELQTLKVRINGELVDPWTSHSR